MAVPLLLKRFLSRPMTRTRNRAKAPWLVLALLLRFVYLLFLSLATAALHMILLMSVGLIRRTLPGSLASRLGGLLFTAAPARAKASARACLLSLRPNRMPCSVR